MFRLREKKKKSIDPASYIYIYVYNYQDTYIIIFKWRFNNTSRVGFLLVAEQLFIYTVYNYYIKIGISCSTARIAREPFGRSESHSQFLFVVDRLVGGLPPQVGRYERGQQEPESQQPDDHHVGGQVAHGAEHPAVDRRQDEADELRAAVQQPAGRAFRDRVRQLDGQLVADRQVSGHEQPAGPAHGG